MVNGQLKSFIVRVCFHIWFVFLNASQVYNLFIPWILLLTVLAKGFAEFRTGSALENLWKPNQLEKLVISSHGTVCSLHAIDSRLMVSQLFPTNGQPFSLKPFRDF